MKRCLQCAFECEYHASTCPGCGESSWIDLEMPARELELVTIPDSPAPLKRNR